MSFTTEVKDELSRVAPSCSHCDRALLSALVRIEGTLHLSGQGKCHVDVVTDSANVARLVIRLSHAAYDLRTESTVRRSVLHRIPNYLVGIPEQPQLMDALSDLGIISADGLVSGIDRNLVEKRCCSAAYLRGVFLGSGFIASPKGDFHFEMTVESEELANDIVDLLDERGIGARTMQRRNNYIVYMKSGTAITEFLALTGAHHCALTIENERVIKSMRNDVNRIVNAEVANQAKAADAGLSQIMDIKTILEAHRLDDLSPALQQFVLLRAANPHASIKELGELADPPLSKSAVYHRIRRIEQLANEIRDARV